MPHRPADDGAAGGTRDARSHQGGYDAQAIRAQFPTLAVRPHGQRLAYLDNAATTQKPAAVLDAMDRYYREENSNVHRGVHLLAERATQSYEAAREKVRAFINARSTREIVFVRGTTEAINLVAHAFARPLLRPGDEILVTHLEHHSNIVPWQIVTKATGAHLRVVPVKGDGRLDLDRIPELLTNRTRLVALAHVSNALGTVNPVKEIVRAAHAAGAKVLIDGAQAVPHIPVDVQDLGCDFYAFSGHKMYGPTGIGVLWGREERLQAMPPFQGGGDMILSVRFDKTEYNELPYKFEAGTPNVAGAIGLGAAVDWLQGVGLENVQRHEHALLERATRELSRLPGVRLVGTAPGKAAVLSFVLEGIHPHDVGTLLDQEGVAIRTGHHCAQPLMERFKVPATCRASFAAYNTDEDVDALVAAVKKVQEVFR